MKELTISRKRYNQFDLTIKYDETKYDFEYVEALRKIILRRISDNIVLHIFDEPNVMFITQYDEKKENNQILTHFLSEEMIPGYKESDKHVSQFIDYEAPNYREILLDNEKYPCDDVKRVNDGSYIIQEDSYSNIVYSVENGHSKRFKAAYTDDEIKEIMGRDIVFVEDKEFCTQEVSDTMIYGIDPTTFKIITAIRSNGQKRWIELYDNYTLKELSDIVFKKGYYGVHGGIAADDKDSVTIFLEVEHYLNQLVGQIPRDESICDRYTDKVNKELIKEFATRPVCKKHETNDKKTEE